MQQLNNNCSLLKYSTCKFWVCVKRTDTCIERWWKYPQGVGVGEVEPTTKVINATRTVWNFQKPVQGNFILWL